MDTRRPRNSRETTLALAFRPLTPTLSPEYRGEGVVFRRFPTPAAHSVVIAAVLLGIALVVAEPVLAEQLPEIVHRLPPIEAGRDGGGPFADEAPAFRLARDPPEYRTPEEVLPSRLPQLPEWPQLLESPQLSESPHLTDHKDSFFQKLSLSGAYILQDGSDGLGQVETVLFATFAVPAPTTDWPLLLIPTLEPTALNGPAALALPSWVYAAHLDLMWLPKFGERWLGVLAVSPGWYSDFQGDAADSFRLTGQAVVRYDWTPNRLQFVLGAAYINRINRTWLPVAGAIWKPTDDWNCQVIFPEAKIGRRMGWGVDYEHWLYLAGGFGGNNWRVQRPDGESDILAILDWRVMVGWERKTNGGAGLYAELGYVFSRELEFESSGIIYPFGNTLLVRAGIAF